MIGLLVSGAYLSLIGLFLLNDLLRLRSVYRFERSLGDWLTEPGVTYRGEAGMEAIWTLGFFAGLLLCMSLLLLAVSRILMRRAAQRATANAAV